MFRICPWNIRHDNIQVSGIIVNIFIFFQYNLNT